MAVKAYYDDGTSKTVTNYTYSPSGVLTTGNTYITVSYTENGVTKTATQAITVTRVLQSIAITKAPNKTEYIIGEFFDKTGMVVKANYNDGTNEIITNYTYTPSGALDTDTANITISYAGKTAQQSIEVKTLFDGLGTVNNAVTDYLDNPKINLQTGRMLYLSPDLSVGVNSYEIGVSHVYNSQFGALSHLFSTCGNGWKLDMEQLLLKQTTNGFDEYKYIDDTGHVHSFNLFDTNRYYDISDPGVVLEITTDGVYMKDDSGNTVKFRSDGKVDYTVAGLNEKIKKQFLYDNQSRLTRIYDTRKGQKESVGFTYSNTTGLLTSITQFYNSTASQKIYYYYDSVGNLVETKTVVCNDSGTDAYTKTANVFFYDDANKLTMVTNPETKGAVKVVYLNAKAVKVAKGIVNGTFVTVNSSSFESGFVEKTYMQITDTKTYNSSCIKEVTFTNERSVKSVLQLNEDGKVVSTFERDGNTLRTLERESGVYLSGNSNTDG